MTDHNDDDDDDVLDPKVIMEQFYGEMYQDRERLDAVIARVEELSSILLGMNLMDRPDQTGTPVLRFCR